MHAPRWLYGKQHSELDQALRALGPLAAMVRFSKVIAPTVPVFSTWLESLRDGKIIRPLTDLSMAPVPLAFIVDLIAEVGMARRAGTFQASGARDITYAEAGRVAAEQLGASQDLVRPTTTAELGLNIGWQPPYTTLDMTETEEAFGMTAPTIEQAMAALAPRQPAVIMSWLTIDPGNNSQEPVRLKMANSLTSIPRTISGADGYWVGSLMQGDDLQRLTGEIDRLFLQRIAQAAPDRVALFPAKE